MCKFHLRTDLRNGSCSYFGEFVYFYIFIKLFEWYLCDVSCEWCVMFLVNDIHEVNHDVSSINKSEILPKHLEAASSFLYTFTAFSNCWNEGLDGIYISAPVTLIRIGKWDTFPVWLSQWSTPMVELHHGVSDASMTGESEV